MTDDTDRERYFSKVNQQQIADMLGISRTTVSRCFTNHPGINPVTRAKVFDLASQLGYQHMEARAPARSKDVSSRRVGVLVCTDIDEYLGGAYKSPGVRLYAGVSEFAQLSNIKLEIHYVNPKETSLDEPSYRKLTPLKKRDWDGVLLIYPFPRNVVDEIERRFPMVSLVKQYGTAAINCVDVDHYEGVTAMMNKLAELGHARIGFCTRHYEVEAQWSLRRFSAYVEKMVRWGRDLRDEDIVNVRTDRSMSLDRSFDHIAQRARKGVTAWVCAADHQAYDLIAGLEKRGIRVPRDVSVTGFDGIRKPERAPLLTTAVIPYWEIGYTGAKRLMAIVQKRFGSPQHVLIAPRFREGETIGPAATPRKRAAR
jgi:DNA-binding LacI/PurR family transcriptional regulator